MKNLTLFILMLGVMLLPAQNAKAAPIFLEQFWDANPLIDDNGRAITARTVGRWDDSAITGVGTEDLLLDYFNLIVFADGIGQYFAQTTFPFTRTDPGTGQFLEGNIFARYVGGIFSILGSVDNGGNPAVGLFNENGTDSGIRVIVNGTSLLEGRSQCCFERRYVLASETLTNLDATVPEPATLILMSLGLLGMGFNRRKRFQ